MYKLLIYCGVCLVLGGCVSASRYKKLEKQRDDLSAERDARTEELAALKRQQRRDNAAKAADNQQLSDSLGALLNEKSAYISDLKGQLKRQDERCEKRVAEAMNSGRAAALRQQEQRDFEYKMLIINELRDSVLVGLDTAAYRLGIDGGRISLRLREDVLFKPAGRFTEPTARPFLLRLANFLRRRSDLYVTLLSYVPEAMAFLAQVRTSGLHLFFKDQKVDANRLYQVMRERPAQVWSNATEIWLATAPF